MNIITLDFETYYDIDYTLSKMTTESYVRDPRFEVHGVGIRWNEYPDARLDDTIWYRDDIAGYLAQIDWSTTACLCHHAQFDGLILSHHYGIRPAFWLDTLSMARLLIGNHLSVGLGNLAKHFGLGAKDIPYELFAGKHWDELTPDVQRMVADGCCTDVQLTWDLFLRLAGSFPQEEFALVDATVRMFTEPILVGDTNKLADIWSAEARAKASLIAEIDPTGKLLRGNESFAELLRAEGVEPETKDGKNGPIYAFAKTDDFMRDLLDGEDERVAALAEARLSEKSNGIQTRTERLGHMSVRGNMAVYLNYCGAHTTRWSGGDKVNWQNLKRGGPIAQTIRAPQDHAIVVDDASQIECRILNFVAGQWDVIERFAQKADPYVAIASQFYGFQVTKAHEKERGTGKQLELSCGYGAGGPTIQATAKKGTYGPPVFLTDAQSMQARDLYRETHTAVVAYWGQASDVLKKLHAGMELEWGPLYIKDKRIWLPNGAPLIYETLEWHEDVDDKGWRVRTRKFGWSRMYGAKLVENVIQALARLHVSQVWIRCMQAGIRVVSMEHDKLIAVVREHEAQAAFDYMKAEMSRAPDWLPGIPLDSEGYISHTLAKPEKGS